MGAELVAELHNFELGSVSHLSTQAHARLLLEKRCRHEQKLVIIFNLKFPTRFKHRAFRRWASAAFVYSGTHMLV